MPNDRKSASKVVVGTPPTARRLSIDEIEDLQTQASRGGGRLQRKLGLPAQDAEDMRQELLLDVIARLGKFDPSRGSLGAYSRVIMRHQASRLADRYCRNLTAQGGSTLPLKDAERLETSPDWDGGASDRFAVQQGLRSLSTTDLHLCRALSAHSVTTLTAMGGFGSRSSIYRRIRTLRPQLALAGLGPGWDVLASA